MTAKPGFKIVLAFILAAASVSSVYAHGPQLQTGIQFGRIVTRALYADEPYDNMVTNGQRVFEIPMAERNLGDANDGWYSQPNGAYLFTGPGIATSLGGFATGSIISLTFADGLKIWNGVSFVDPGTEQIDAYRGATHVAGAVTSDSGPFQSFSFTAITNAVGEHKTAFFRLLGDGVIPDSPSDDGIYLLSLELQTDEPGVNPTQPYYYLFNKNASGAEAAAALAYVNANLAGETVPTASNWAVAMAALIVLTAATLTVASRRRRPASEIPSDAR